MNFYQTMQEELYDDDVKLFLAEAVDINAIRKLSPKKIAKGLVALYSRKGAPAVKEILRSLNIVSPSEKAEIKAEVERYSKQLLDTPIWKEIAIGAM